MLELRGLEAIVDPLRVHQRAEVIVGQREREHGSAVFSQARAQLRDLAEKIDAVALRRSIVNNGIGGLCVTKLDVLDGVDPVRLCVEYGDDGTPRYEDMPGWRESTAGLRSLVELPRAARAYLERLESACGVPVTMVSTGAERDETIVSRHPFG